jgi:hypothetical protein
LDDEMARVAQRPKAEAPEARPIPDYRIRNLATFTDVTSGDRRLAALYFWHKLDCLVELGYAVSCDFFKRPHLYLDLEGARDREEPDRPAPSIAPKLAELYARYGTDEKIPSTAQRDRVFSSVFGGTSGSDRGDGEFPRLRDDLLLAAARFAERPADEGVEMLKEGVRTSVRPFNTWLRGFLGASIEWSTGEVLPDLTEARVYPILRAQGVAGVFGIVVPVSSSWPYDQDPNGDKLVEEAYKQLALSGDTQPPMTRERFINLQRAALRGAEAIATALDFDEEKPLQEENLARVITKAYTWLAALQNISPSHANRMSADTRTDGCSRAPYTPTESITPS